MKQNNLSPSKELYLKVRAGFIARGTSLHKWCDEQGIKPSNARIALIGGWDGPKGKALRVERTVSDHRFVLNQLPAFAVG